MLWEEVYNNFKEIREKHNDKLLKWAIKVLLPNYY
jgi:hypothetical protein